MSTEKILIGNSFPLSLIRTNVSLMQKSVDELRWALLHKEVASFWGHENTRPWAEELLGVSLRPQVSRPVLTLAANCFPMLDGEVFDECWVLSPNYKGVGRPKIGEEVQPSQIVGWQVVKIDWKQERN